MISLNILIYILNSILYSSPLSRKTHFENPIYYCSTHPHQVYFEFLAEHGLVGSFILLLILFYLIFSKVKIILASQNYIQIGCLAFLLILFLPLLPSGAFFGDYSLTLFWINLSIMYSVGKKTNIYLNN